jgi:hypothetical protein
VDYDDPDDYYPDDIRNEDEGYDNKEDKEDEIEDQLKQIDPEEIEDIIRDARGDTNPNVHEPNNNVNEEQLEQPVEQQEAPDESIRRLTGETRPIKRL